MQEIIDGHATCATSAIDSILRAMLCIMHRPPTVEQLMLMESITESTVVPTNFRTRTGTYDYEMVRAIASTFCRPAEVAKHYQESIWRRYEADQNWRAFTNNYLQMASRAITWDELIQRMSRLTAFLPACLFLIGREETMSAAEKFSPETLLECDAILHRVAHPKFAHLFPNAGEVLAAWKSSPVRKAVLEGTALFPITMMNIHSSLAFYISPDFAKKASVGLPMVTMAFAKNSTRYPDHTDAMSIALRQPHNRRMLADPTGLPIASLFFPSCESVSPEGDVVMRAGHEHERMYLPPLLHSTHGHRISIMQSHVRPRIMTDSSNAATRAALLMSYVAPPNFLPAIGGYLLSSRRPKRETEEMWALNMFAHVVLTSIDGLMLKIGLQRELMGVVDTWLPEDGSVTRRDLFEEADTIYEATSSALSKLIGMAVGDRDKSPFPHLRLLLDGECGDDETFVPKRDVTPIDVVEGKESLDDMLRAWSESHIVESVARPAGYDSPLLDIWHHLDDTHEASLNFLMKDSPTTCFAKLTRAQLPTRVAMLTLEMYANIIASGCSLVPLLKCGAMLRESGPPEFVEAYAELFAQDGELSFISKRALRAGLVRCAPMLDNHRSRYATREDLGEVLGV